MGGDRADVRDEDLPVSRGPVADEVEQNWAKYQVDQELNHGDLWPWLNIDWISRNLQLRIW